MFNACALPALLTRVLLVKRIKSNNVTAICSVLSLWLTETYGCQVCVEQAALQDFLMMGCTSVKVWDGRATIDLVISLGGDGTTLWAASLFVDSTPIPPVLGVTLGSLSYINQFSADELVTTLREVFHTKKCTVQHRSRLYIRVFNKQKRMVYQGHCVNECVVDRGKSSNMASLDIFVNEHFFTSMSADGLILGTPTGSTAYSMSAGGAVVHPSVPCILFTPICPHSLSMRPVVLPDTVRIKICVPHDARGSVLLSLDGHNKIEVLPGFYVEARLSDHPVPLICRRPDPEKGDQWLPNLTDNLLWGLRIRQRKFDDSAAKNILCHALPPDLREWFTKHPLYQPLQSRQ